MNLTSSGISNDKRDTSSDGPLIADYMTPWHPHSLDWTTSDTGKSHFGLVPDVLIPAHITEFSTNVEQHPRTPEESEMAFWCHLLIEFMPREGLRELLISVFDVYTIYKSPRVESPALLPSVSHKKAVYGGKVKNPPFVIEFDEG